MAWWASPPVRLACAASAAPSRSLKRFSASSFGSSGAGIVAWPIDRDVAATNYHHYFDEHVLADEVGFDGLMINEHHSTPSCSDVSIMMSAAILARQTKRAKIALMGNILPIQDNPVMVAEQIAMADLISGGRIISGFVWGIGVETW